MQLRPRKPINYNVDTYYRDLEQRIHLTKTRSVIQNATEYSSYIRNKSSTCITCDETEQLEASHIKTHSCEKPYQNFPASSKLSTDYDNICLK